tara:strand:+ start:3282 stop:4043 length:762 start_codon:yes stop_codon:yes gene_type:complete
MRTFIITLLATVIGFVSLPAHSEQTVRLAASNWPPYVDTSLPDKGFIYEIVKEAYESQGYRPVIQILPWYQAIELDKRHNDGAFPDYEPYDEQGVVCSKPIFGGPVGLYKRKDSPLRWLTKDPAQNQEQAFRALRQYRFGIVDGYLNTQAFDNADYLKKSIVDNDYQNLKQLANKQVDFAMTDIFTAEYLMEKHKPELDNIVFMGPSLENKKIYVCFSKNAKNYQAKINALNTGLDHLTETGQLDDIVRKYNF